MASNSNILTVRIFTDASSALPGLKTAEQMYGKFGAALGVKSKSAGSEVGNALVSGIDKTLGVGLKVAAGGAAVLAATAFAKGFQRLNALDQANAKLRGLGHSAEEVAKIMANANSAVKGTAFGLDEAATTAASVVAAGIKPGKELESVLTLVADSATIAGSSMADMGGVFGKVAASNKLSGDVINQLTDRGIPVLQLLADHYNTTAEAASEMVSRGEVDFANFAASMQEGMGGAALKSGETFQGAWENTLSAIGRIGQNILSPLFEGAKDGLQGLPELLAPIEEKAKDVGAALAEVLKWVQKNGTLLSRLGSIAGITIGILLTFRTIVGVMQAYQAVMAIVKAAQLAYTAASYGTAAATYVGTGATLAQNIALLAGKAAYLAVALGAKIAAAAQWLWNAAVSANPVVLLVLAIIALIAVIVFLWIKSEAFRNFFIGMWNAIVAVAVAVWEWIVNAATAAWASLTNGGQQIADFFVGVWNRIVDVAVAVWNWIVTAAQGAWNLLIAAASAYLGFWLGIWNRIVAVAIAVWNAILAAAGTVWSGIRAGVQGVASFFSTVFNNIKSFATDVWSAILSSARTVFDTLKDVVNTVFDAIMVPIDAVADAFNAVVDAVKSVIDWISRIKIPDLAALNPFKSAAPQATYGYTINPIAAGRGLLRGQRVATSPTVTGGGGGGGLTIVIQGGLDSADTIARRVEQLLAGRERRSGGVTIRRRTT